MSQLHEALSHYWNLRNQGLSPASSAQHVRLRYGVTIDFSKLPPAESVAEQRALRKGDRIRDCDGDLATVIRDEVDGHVDIEWDNPEYGEDGLGMHVYAPDVTLVNGDEPVSVGFGSEFCRTIIGAGDSGRRS